MRNKCFKSAILKQGILITVVMLLTVVCGFSQTAVVKGFITNDWGDPIESAVVRGTDFEQQTITNEHGHYSITVPAGRTIQLYIQHLSHRDTLITLQLKSKETHTLDVVLHTTGERLQTVNINGAAASGYVQVNPKLSFQLPSPTGGMESLIKMLPGTSSTNELSSQYNVRGGNFDENLVFVNGIQIYRPFLVRNAQQEGMSFINSDLTGSVMFSAGGFDAKYGDKMSSVLDVRYKEPTKFGGSVSASLLGATAHAEGKINNFTFLIGVRFKSNAYLLKSLETAGNYKPRFFDTQFLLNWKLNPKWSVSLLGNVSRNYYQFQPDSVNKNFGTIEQTMKLRAFYEGQEVDRYQNYLGGLTFRYQHDKNNLIRLILSSYYAKESETYDILAQYWLNDVRLSGDGEVEIGDQLGYGSYLEHARNHLTSVVSAVDLQGVHDLPFLNKLEWGMKVQNEYINDHIKEWVMIDSSGYTLPMIPTTPGEVVVAGDPARELYFGDNNYLVSNNMLNTWRFTGYIQDTWKIDNDSLSRFMLTGGLRYHFWTYNPKEFTVSPRLAFIYKPRWKHDWQFSLRTGLYYQPAFYREMRYPDGTLNPDILSQRSAQVVAGSEYHFTLWRRPFKFTAEAYYKYLDRLITYNVNNVQIIYSGYNNAKGFATGIDLRISGEFVRGLESWFSVSLMKTMEDVIGDYKIDADGNMVEVGYIPRPTDQRVAFNLFFQDHIPSFPQFRVHLNFVFASGLPYGPPNAEPAMRVFRTTWYRRVDLGLSFMLLEQSRDRMKHKSPFLRSIRNAGIYLEVFNILNINNVSSYMWFTDIYNFQRPVPTYLTGRLVNVKLLVEF